MNISYYSPSPCLFLLLPTFSPSSTIPTLPPHLTSPHLTILPHYLTSPPLPTTSPSHLSSLPHLVTSPCHLTSQPHPTQPPHPPPHLSFLPHISHFPGTRSTFSFPGGVSLTFWGTKWVFLFQEALSFTCLGAESPYPFPVVSVFALIISGVCCLHQPTAEGLLKVVRPSAAEWHYTSLKPHLYAEGRALFGRPSAIKSQTFRAKSSCRFSPAARAQKRIICFRKGQLGVITGTRSAILFQNSFSSTF